MRFDASQDHLSFASRQLSLFPVGRLVVMHGCFQKLYWKSMLELLQDHRIIFVILCFSCQFGKFGDVVIDVTPFHLQLVKFGSSFVMGICIIPVLDEILFEFFPYIYMWGHRYWSPHDPVFYASFPFSYCCTLYKGEGVRNFLIRVVHKWGVGVEKLVELELVHEFVSSCSISRKDHGFFPFQFPISVGSGCLWRCWGCSSPASTSASPTASTSASSTSATTSRSRDHARWGGGRSVRLKP